MALVAALVILGVGAAWYLVGPGESDGSDRTAAPGTQTAGATSAPATSTASASPTTSPTAAPTPSPTPSAAAPRTAGIPALPAGFVWHRDRTGFGVAIPRGWRVERNGRFTYFREPGGDRYLLVDQTTEPRPDAVADWTAQEAVRRQRMPDYRRIAIRPVDYFLEAADWEFTYTKPGVGPVHVNNRGAVTSADQAYGLYWLTPADQWEESWGIYTVITSTFRPRP